MSAGAYRHLDSLSALLPRVASVRTAADLEAVLPTVAAIAREASGATCVTIVLRSPGGGIEPVAFHGPEHLREALAGSEDTVWVALTDTDGTPLGHLGASGLAEEQSSILAAVAAYGAQALRRARASIAATRHRAALEALMRLRAGFDVRDGVDGLLAAVADAVRGTLGYHRVAIELGEDAIGWEQAVVMPLQAGDRRLGVLVAGDDHDTGPYDAEALGLLRLFAEIAADRILATETHAVAEQLAETDALTGLGNRGMFVRRAERALRIATGDVALLVCDIDGLKALNDSEGHAAGDALLRLAAGVLARACADGETAHRLGGDEFAVLVPAGGAERAARLAADFAAALRAAGASASVGWAAGRAPVTIDELLDRADTGMYRVKRGRRALRD